MKIFVGSYRAKTELLELLRQVQMGKSFTITNRGDAIADLVPSVSKTPRNRAASVEKLKALMRNDPVPDVNIKALIEAGRK
jgi:antitoxin (DNA-binding transcriptional repressor) of toxin-antitoxin stability system